MGRGHPVPSKRATAKKTGGRILEGEPVLSCFSGQISFLFVLVLLLLLVLNVQVGHLALNFEQAEIHSCEFSPHDVLSSFWWSDGIVLCIHQKRLLPPPLGPYIHQTQTQTRPHRLGSNLRSRGDVSA